MKYLKSIIFFICLFTVFLLQTWVYAADDAEACIPEIVFEDGTSYPVDLIDSDRAEDKVVLYTKSYGSHTKPFSPDTREFIAVNNIVVCENTKSEKGTDIPENGFVLSYTGKDANFLKNLYPGRGFTLANIDIPAIPDMYFELEGMTVPIDQVNSARGANQAILYNPSFGASTKTNAWGIELTIVNNIITKTADLPDANASTAGNDSTIPPDGMVISIHSGSKYYKQIHEIAKPGTKVTINDGSSILYNAVNFRYSAYNPRTIDDNPFAWDKEKDKPYDSFRGPNQLIIYDSSYGERTGTNPYGYEVAVSSKGIIVGTGGNDSEIPAGGYILSGHGNCLKWLEKNALLGSEVVINTVKKEVSILLTPRSYINRASYSIKSAQESLKSRKLQYLDIPYDKVQDTIAAAEAKLDVILSEVDEGQYEGLTNTVKDIQKDADTAYYMTFESPKVENRAVWLRPREKNLNEVIKKLDKLKDLNINIIYLETYWNGYAIYPAGCGLMQQNPMFNGFDVLASYLKEAHARGIEVHAWVEDFLVDTPIASKKPEWMAVSRKGDAYYLENGITKYYFLNPALPEVRDFLSGLYKELVKKYNLDGLQFDYMRYPDSGDYSNDFGYDAYTRQLFTNLTGTDPIGLKPGDALWEKWCGFREYIISSYAGMIISEVKSIKPYIQISADVWPDYETTLIDKYQDPKAWARHDYINTLIPMSYYLYEEPVVDDIMNTWAFARGHSQLASGIATYTKVDTKVLLRQVDAIRAADTNGISIFEFDSLFSGNYANALKLGAFSNPSAVTNRDAQNSLELLLNDILRKFDDIYIKYGGINTAQAEKYRKLIQGISINLDEGLNDTEAAYNLKNNIQDIQKSIAADEGLNLEVAERILSDLNCGVNILDGYISGIRLMTEHKVSEFKAELSYKALQSGNPAPLKVKASFDDGAVMYLDSSQYILKSSEPDNTAVNGEVSIKKPDNGKKSILIEIQDSFNFSTANGTDRKLSFNIDDHGRASVNGNSYGILTASETGYTKVQLYWCSKIVNSDISGYVIYRNGAEIARVFSEKFKDENLQSGSNYTYEVHGFDISGNIIYKSNQLTVRTKGPILFAVQH